MADIFDDYRHDYAINPETAKEKLISNIVFITEQSIINRKVRQDTGIAVYEALIKHVENAILEDEEETENDN